MSDGNMKINEARSTRYFASPVLNHLMTWGFALIQETLTLMSMSQSMSLVEVVCDVSSIIVIFCPAPNLEVFAFWEVFRPNFGMEGPMQLIAIPST